METIVSSHMGRDRVQHGFVRHDGDRNWRWPGFSWEISRLDKPRLSWVMRIVVVVVFVVVLCDQQPMSVSVCCCVCEGDGHTCWDCYTDSFTHRQTGRISGATRRTDELTRFCVNLAVSNKTCIQKGQTTANNSTTNSDNNRVSDVAAIVRRKMEAAAEAATAAIAATAAAAQDEEPANNDDQMVSIQGSRHVQFGVMEMSGQTNEERRELRQSYRALAKRMEAKADALSDPNNEDVYTELRSKTNVLFEQVRYTREAVLDGDVWSQMAVAITKQADKFVEVRVLSLSWSSVQEWMLCFISIFILARTDDNGGKFRWVRTKLSICHLLFLSHSHSLTHAHTLQTPTTTLRFPGTIHFV